MVARIAGRDHVAAPVDVELNWLDRLSDFDVGVCLDDARLLAHAIEAPDLPDHAGSQRPRLSGEERDPEWLFEAGESDVVRDRFSEGLEKHDLDEIDPGSMTNEVGHLPGRDTGAYFDDAYLAALADDQLGKCDAVYESAGLDRCCCVLPQPQSSCWRTTQFGSR